MLYYRGFPRPHNSLTGPLYPLSQCSGGILKFSSVVIWARIPDGSYWYPVSLKEKGYFAVKDKVQFQIAGRMFIL